MSEELISENISYIPAKDFPLSSDAVFISTEKGTWIYDTGTSSEAAEKINSIKGPKFIVLSHFHPDHVGNLLRIGQWDKLFVSRNTEKYVKSGTIIEDSAEFDQIRLLCMPSSHAKGSLVLIYKDYAFLGDSTYAKISKKGRSYNVQLLKAQIEALEALPVKYFCLSHARRFVQKKESVIGLLKGIYENRVAGETEISVEGFFNK